MMPTHRVLLVLALALAAQPLGTSATYAQARDTVATLRTAYNTVRTQANPQGAVKTELDTLEADVARAAQRGRTSEMRRLYTKGIALATGNAWTAEAEFSASLVLRTEQVFIDPSAPVTFRVEQTYQPALDLSAPLTLRVALHRAGPAGVQAGDTLRDIGVLENVHRDLIDDPFRFDVDLSGVPDGRVVVRAEAMAGAKVLGTTSTLVHVSRGLRDRLRRLESDAAQLKGFEDLRAEVLYPGDFIRHADRGRIALPQVRQFDLDRELTTAEAALAALKAGRDPFAGRTGDLTRHYRLREAGEILPYRVYVPTSYTGDRALPLIIALHGNGGTQNTFFDSFERRMPQLAEERGYIVAAPLGYRVDGGWGYNNLARPAEDLTKLEFSEKTVTTVLDLVKRQYRVDDTRIYLAGHSMGGGGTWHIGPRYPQVWAALAPFAGVTTPATAPQVKDIPQFVVHGDADATVSVQRSRDMVAELKRLGVEHQYVEVPGGTHGNIVAPNLPAMFDFFDRHRRRPGTN